MMLPLRDETLTTNSRIGSPSTFVWFYFTAEFWIGGLLSAFLTILGILKSLLPKPPRDLTGDVVLVAGATSSLGESLAEEFAKGGCSVICVDKDLRSVEAIASRLSSRYQRVEEIRPRHRKDDSAPRPRTSAYECDLTDREDIRRTARKIKDEVGRIDVLVTCVGSPEQDIFDTASRTLMSHYWAVLSFLPSMLNGERAHVVGVTPVASREDGYFSSRAAVASLMESLGQELSNHSTHLTFLSISPVAERNTTKESEEKVARDVIHAVRRDQCSLSVNWFSKMLYRMSCIVYTAITMITQWMYTQDCDYSL